MLGDALLRNAPQHEDGLRASIKTKRRAKARRFRLMICELRKLQRYLIAVAWFAVAAAPRIFNFSALCKGDA